MPGINSRDVTPLSLTPFAIIAIAQSQRRLSVVRRGDDAAPTRQLQRSGAVTAV